MTWGCKIESEQIGKKIYIQTKKQWVNVVSLCEPVPDQTVFSSWSVDYMKQLFLGKAIAQKSVTMQLIVNSFYWFTGYLNPKKKKNFFFGNYLKINVLIQVTTLSHIHMY
jgi:hypothetical protein